MPMIVSASAIKERWQRHGSVSAHMRTITHISRVASSGDVRVQSLVASQQVGSESGTVFYIDNLGVPRAFMTSTFRTVRCVPACRVVWQWREPPMSINKLLYKIGKVIADTKKRPDH